MHPVRMELAPHARLGRRMHAATAIFVLLIFHIAMLVVGILNWNTPCDGTNPPLLPLFLVIYASIGLLFVYLLFREWLHYARLSSLPSYTNLFLLIVFFLLLSVAGSFLIYETVKTRYSCSETAPLLYRWSVAAAFFFAIFATLFLSVPLVRLLSRCLCAPIALCMIGCVETVGVDVEYTELSDRRMGTDLSKGGGGKGRIDDEGRIDGQGQQDSGQHELPVNIAGVVQVARKLPPRDQDEGKVHFVNPLAGSNTRFGLCCVGFLQLLLAPGCIVPGRSLIALFVNTAALLWFFLFMGFEVRHSLHLTLPTLHPPYTPPSLHSTLPTLHPPYTPLPPSPFLPLRVSHLHLSLTPAFYPSPLHPPQLWSSWEIVCPAFDPGTTFQSDVWGWLVAGAPSPIHWLLLLFVITGLVLTLFGFIVDLFSVPQPPPRSHYEVAMWRGRMQAKAVSFAILAILFVVWGIMLCYFTFAGDDCNRSTPRLYNIALLLCLLLAVLVGLSMFLGCCVLLDCCISGRMKFILLLRDPPENFTNEPPHDAEQLHVPVYDSTLIPGNPSRKDGRLASKSSYGTQYGTPDDDMATSRLERAVERGAYSYFGDGPPPGAPISGPISKLSKRVDAAV